MSNIVNSRLLTWSILEDRPTSLINAVLRQQLKRYAVQTFYSVERGKEIWIWKSLLNHERDILIPDLDFSSRTFTSEHAALSHALEMIKLNGLSEVTLSIAGPEDTKFY
jgi:hypothetical protein